MSKEFNFLIYCMERYGFYKKLFGKDTAREFEQYDLYNYVTRYFESLHTMGDQAIMQDIDAYIAESNKGI
jgi:hypothetical protein